jgi:hypothetical protein
MNVRLMISLLFRVAAVYDGLLGLAFLFAGGAVFRWIDLTPPNHPGYLQFPAALLLVFSVMFLAIARDPAGNRNLIPYGILLKVSYCGVVLFHWLTTDLPWIWKPFCVLDFLFIVFFVQAWVILRKSPEEA